VSAEAAMVVEFSDVPLIARARKYRDMAVTARREAQAATWFVPRWSYKRQAQRWENLTAEALRELRMEIIRTNRAIDAPNIDCKKECSSGASTNLVESMKRHSY
jgi:hypothetical protein